MVRKTNVEHSPLWDYLQCENDEGYGCTCCPGRNEAIAELRALQAAVTDTPPEGVSLEATP